MTDSADPRSLRELLEHQGWVRELARRLVRGPGEADDVVQSTWVAALERPPALDASGTGNELDPERARQWLAAVVRNAARQLWRGEGRRAAREQAAARAEALPSAEELVLRAALQRRVAEAVEELAEPYRSALLLRYFEELPPREIARRAGVPVETVRTRIARGIDRLRSKLDRDFGDRRTWVVALVPIARGAGGPLGPAVTAPGAPGGPWHPVPPAAIGATLVNTKLVAAFVGASALGLGTWLALRPAATSAAPAERAPARSTVELAVPAEEAAGAAIASAPKIEAPRTAVEPAAEPAPAAPPVVPSALTALAGRVLDAEGRALAGVGVELDPGGAGPIARAESGAAGRFTLETQASAGQLLAADEAWTTVFGSRWSRGQTREPLVVVAPSAAVAGEVVDEEGNLLGGVTIAITPPADLRSRLGVVLDEAVEQRVGCVSGADGAFDLARVPLVAGATLSAHHEEFLPRALPLAEVAGYLVIQLERPEVPENHVGGIVLDPMGLPAAGAHVALGVDTALSGADGRFALELGARDSFSAMLGLEPTTLTAVKRGYLPAVFEAPLADGAAELDGPRAWPSFVTLRLGGEPRSLAGVVLDHRGDPVENARVWLADPTFLGAIDGVPTPIEHVLNGVQTHWATVDVDAQGRFRLEGLLERDYRLRAMDPATLVYAEFGPFAAGSEVVLSLPTDRVHARVAGRVVSPSGEPLAGVTVHPMCDPYVARIEGRVIGTSHWMVDGTTTDAQGRFELVNVPVSLVYLRVEGESILPLEYGRVPAPSGRPGEAEPQLSGLPGDSILELEIEVVRRAHVRVELRVAGAADRFAVLDGAGEPLLLNLMQAGSRSESTRMPIHAGGRSDTLAVPETGAVVVLYLGADEVARLPLKLVPGEVATVVF